jgi:transposase
LLFGVSVASVVRWSQRFRATGSVAAYPVGGDRRSCLTGERAWLLGRIAAKPDVTLRELVVELDERGVMASYGSVWRFFRGEGISFKKNRARQRAGQARRRPPPRSLDTASGLP